MQIPVPDQDIVLVAGTACAALGRMALRPPGSWSESRSPSKRSFVELSRRLPMSRKAREKCCPTWMRRPQGGAGLGAVELAVDLHGSGLIGFDWRRCPRVGRVVGNQTVLPVDGGPVLAGCRIASRVAPRSGGLVPARLLGHPSARRGGPGRPFHQGLDPPRFHRDPDGGPTRTLPPGPSTAVGADFQRQQAVRMVLETVFRPRSPPILSLALQVTRTTVSSLSLSGLAREERWRGAPVRSRSNSTASGLWMKVRRSHLSVVLEHRPVGGFLGPSGLRLMAAPSARPALGRAGIRCLWGWRKGPGGRPDHPEVRRWGGDSGRWSV